MANGLARSCSAIAMAMANVFKTKYNPGEEQQPRADEFETDGLREQRLKPGRIEERVGGNPHRDRWRRRIEQDALDRQPRSHQSRRDRQAVDRDEHRAGCRAEDHRAGEREDVRDREARRNRRNPQHCRSADQRQSDERPPFDRREARRQLGDRAGENDASSQQNEQDVRARPRAGRSAQTRIRRVRELPCSETRHRPHTIALGILGSSLHVCSVQGHLVCARSVPATATPSLRDLVIAYLQRLTFLARPGPRLAKAESAIHRPS